MRLIKLSHTAGYSLLVNPDHIVQVEPVVSAPGSLLRLSSPDITYVKESPEEIEKLLNGDRVRLEPPGYTLTHTALGGTLSWPVGDVLERQIAERQAATGS